MLHPPPPVPTTVMRGACRKRQNSLVVHSEGSSTNAGSGTLRANAPHCMQPRWRTPLKLGRRPCLQCRCPRTTCIEKWFARSRAAWRRLSDRKLLHRRYHFDYRQLSPARVCRAAMLFQSRTATNSTLGTRPWIGADYETRRAGDISHSRTFRGCVDATSGVTSAVSRCSSRTYTCPAR